MAAKVAWGGYAASRPKAIALVVHGCEPHEEPITSLILTLLYFTSNLK